MLKVKKETDDIYGVQVHFFLTRGDSCYIYITPKKNGQPISFDLIDKCVFKLSTLQNVLEFEKELELASSGDKYLLRLTPEETYNFKVGSHIYEIKYKLNDEEDMNTANRWTFDITPTILTT